MEHRHIEGVANHARQDDQQVLVAKRQAFLEALAKGAPSVLRAVFLAHAASGDPDWATVVALGRQPSDDGRKRHVRVAGHRALAGPGKLHR